MHVTNNLKINKILFAHILCSSLIVIIPFIFSVIVVYAGLVDELKTKIDEKGIEIGQLEKEIAQFENEITSLGSQATTLANSVKVLDLTRKKLEADIRLTEGKINSSNLKIQKLELEIGDKAKRIRRDSSAVLSAIRSIDEYETKSLIELVLMKDNISNVWSDLENMSRLQKILRDNVAELKEVKLQREDDKRDTESNKRELLGLNRQLADQKKIVESNKKDKNRLLTTTKNQEANFKKLVAQKQALKEAFEEELRSFETELKIAIDPKSLPAKGSQILYWPIEIVRITQLFGKTSDSGRLYASGTHNGIDLGASTGTSIKAALSGVIVGTGDTDLTCKGASFGKWVLIKHYVGLSTIYAHLSEISVSSGQQVKTGEHIGYSGNTGYSTGPHLHFTVYATDGVNIEQRRSKICNATYTMPIAALNAYLDPMDYLKEI